MLFKFTYQYFKIFFPCQDIAGDFRVNHTLLKPLKFSVFGLGNSLYADNFNVIAKNVDSFLSQLSAERFVPLALGDENVLESKHGTIEQDFQVKNCYFYFLFQ